MSQDHGDDYGELFFTSRQQLKNIACITSAASDVYSRQSGIRCRLARIVTLWDPLSVSEKRHALGSAVC